MTGGPTVAVVGAGTMGAGIAEVFARRGMTVRLYSRSDGTLQRARALLDARGMTEPIGFGTELAACLAGADVVCETVAESLDLKRALFAEFERHAAPDALLTTNTSSIPITAIAASLAQPGRVCGLHWFNPAPVMPLVEVVRGERTTDETVVATRRLADAVGKRSIVVESDVPGFVVNRLQYAMLREALHLVEAGVATRADVDLAVSSTLAPRWSAHGPLRLMDLAGLDVVEAVSRMVYPALSDTADVAPTVSGLVADGALGAKTGRGFFDWTEPERAAAVRARDAMVALVLGQGRTG